MQRAHTRPLIAVTRALTTGMLARIAALCLAILMASAPALSQVFPDWSTGIEAPRPQAPSDGGNVTVVPRQGAEVDGEPVSVQLVAQLTADGQRIEKGLVWRVFRVEQPGDRSALLSTHSEAAPVVKLRAGDYAINAAFGKAHLTRVVKVVAGSPLQVEQFVINAGGLRVEATAGGKPASEKTVTYSIFADRDQSDTRKLVLAGAKPGLIIRLNAGIYHIVSTYGDGNATVRSDVTVEAGKLTEAVISHAAARATFKLVQRAGGEALPDTHWTIQTAQGQEVKESVGALPTHILAPGTYTVIAKANDGRVFQREFTLENGQMAQVEVVMK